MNNLIILSGKESDSSGTENSFSSQLKEKIRMGDLVELCADGKFFLRTDKGYEKYAGYVASIDDNIIGLSPTHLSNRYHGYTGYDSGSGRKREIVPIAIHTIKEYRIFSRDWC